MPIFDNNRAFDEGWGIFECSGSENGPYQLQKLDESDKFRNDIEAWRYVVEVADRESEYHQKALAFLAEHSPFEHQTILDTVNNKAVA
ncbi:hypothetical protein [Bradyrhizobium sp. HKCCYLS20291]|uniref:hypothetical protein n=1 Tax=Bradyrhizobium sp. HKCCYLS20291 TaxID=3420766 RepID=UPI003EB6C7E3